jgi:hypothetical protein
MLPVDPCRVVKSIKVGWEDEEEKDDDMAYYQLDNQKANNTIRISINIDRYLYIYLCVYRINRTEKTARMNEIMKERGTR